MSNRSYDWHGEECHDYDDIINLPHHVSATRPHMSMLDRAAQFSPYAALVGYHDVVKETARLTDTQAELSEQEQELLNKKIALLQTALEQGGKRGRQLRYAILSRTNARPGASMSQSQAGSSALTLCSEPLRWESVILARPRIFRWTRLRI